MKYVLIVIAVVVLDVAILCTVPSQHVLSGLARRLGASIVVNGQLHSDAVKPQGPAMRERRSVPGYTAISLQGSEDIVYTVGRPASLIVEAPGNILPLVRTNVQNGTLMVGQDKAVAAGSVRLLVTGPDLEALSVSGTGSVRMDGLTSQSLRLTISGVSSVTATGAVHQLLANVSGVGNLALSGLRADELTLSCSGMGNIDVTALQTAQVSVSGVGHVTVSGNPAERSTQNSGLGRITYND